MPDEGVKYLLAFPFLYLAAVVGVVWTITLFIKATGSNDRAVMVVGILAALAVIVLLFLVYAAAFWLLIKL